MLPGLNWECVAVATTNRVVIFNLSTGDVVGERRFEVAAARDAVAEETTAGQAAAAGGADTVVHIMAMVHEPTVQTLMCLLSTGELVSTSIYMDFQPTLDDLIQLSHYRSSQRVSAPAPVISVQPAAGYTTIINADLSELYDRPGIIFQRVQAANCDAWPAARLDRNELPRSTGQQLHAYRHVMPGLLCGIWSTPTRGRRKIGGIRPGQVVTALARGVGDWLLLDPAWVAEGLRGEELPAECWARAVIIDGSGNEHVVLKPEGSPAPLLPVVAAAGRGPATVPLVFGLHAAPHHVGGICVTVELDFFVGDLTAASMPESVRLEQDGAPTLVWSDVSAGVVQHLSRLCDRMRHIFVDDLSSCASSFTDFRLIICQPDNSPFAAPVSVRVTFCGIQRVTTRLGCSFGMLADSEQSMCHLITQVEDQLLLASTRPDVADRCVSLLLHEFTSNVSFRKRHRQSEVLAILIQRGILGNTSPGPSRVANLLDQYALDPDVKAAMASAWCSLLSQLPRLSAGADRTEEYLQLAARHKLLDTSGTVGGYSASGTAALIDFVIELARNVVERVLLDPCYRRLTLEYHLYGPALEPVCDGPVCTVFPDLAAPVACVQKVRFPGLLLAVDSSPGDVWLDTDPRPWNGYRLTCTPHIDPIILEIGGGDVDSVIMSDLLCVMDGLGAADACVSITAGPTREQVDHVALGTAPCGTLGPCLSVTGLAVDCRFLAITVSETTYSGADLVQPGCPATPPPTYVVSEEAFVTPPEGVGHVVVDQAADGSLNVTPVLIMSPRTVNRAAAQDIAVQTLEENEVSLLLSVRGVVCSSMMDAAVPAAAGSGPRTGEMLFETATMRSQLSSCQDELRSLLLANPPVALLTSTQHNEGDGKEGGDEEENSHRQCVIASYLRCCEAHSMLYFSSLGTAAYVDPSISLSRIMSTLQLLAEALPVLCPMVSFAGATECYCSCCCATNSRN